MTATVLRDRQESLVGRQSYGTPLSMDRDYHRPSRSTRHTAHSGSSASSNVTRDSAGESGAMSNRLPNPSTDGGNEYDHDWRYSRHRGAMKRRNSQRSPSRPRSQQGSAIETVREADAGQDEEPESNARKVARHDGRQDGYDSKEGTAAATNSAESALPINWTLKGSLSRTMDSDGHSRATKQNTSHTRTPSTEEPKREERTSPREHRGHLPMQAADEQHDPNYTWHSHDRDGRRSLRETDGKSDEGSSSTTARLPSLNAGFVAMAAPPVSLAASYTRGSSPPGRHRGYANAQASITPTHQAIQRHGDGRTLSPRHATSIGAYSDPNYPLPRPGGPASSSAQSPALSNASLGQQQTGPGQPFIHPSLASLQGLGGVAGSKQQPSFVSKLYSMLEDESINEMIAWGPSGTVFSVANPSEFSKIVLPNWFKHSNWQSFVRQLNMYGFHKVNHTYQGTPEEEIQVWEFKHPSFKRGEIQLLNDIKRKSSRHKRQSSFGRSMGGVSAAEYDLMTAGGRSPGSVTPSPEMPIHYLGPPGISREVPTGAPRHQPSRSYVAHPEYPPASYTAPSGVPSQMDHSAPSTGTLLPYASMGPSETAGRSDPGVHSHAPPQQQPHHVQQHRRNQHSGSHSILHGSEAAARLDDQSDRIDAIIRHASYMENQLRSVSDQLYQMQQNEVHSQRHVHYLESQIRELQDLLHVREESKARGLASPSVAAGTAGGLSSSLLLGPGAAAPTPPAAISSSYARSQGSAFSARSPLNSHPTYSSSYARGGGGGGGAAPSAGTTHSSADAYQKLPPAPVSRASSMRHDDNQSPTEASEGRYRD